MSPITFFVLGYTIGFMILDHNSGSLYHYCYNPIFILMFSVLLFGNIISLIYTVIRIRSMALKCRIARMVSLVLLDAYLLILGLALGRGPDTLERLLSIGILTIVGPIIVDFLYVTLER